MNRLAAVYTCIISLFTSRRLCGTTREVEVISHALYTNQVRIVNSRCLYDTTHKVVPVDRLTYEVRLANFSSFHITPLEVEATVHVYLLGPPVQLPVCVIDNS
jgi:hypothetical protein